MRVLQEGSEHCCEWVRMLGLPVDVVGPEGRVVAARRLAQSPAWVQLCALSVRWSRQYFLIVTLVHLWCVLVWG